MAPDFRGRTTGPWEPWLHALPVEFASAQQVYDEFGPVAGQYFLEAFDRVTDRLAAARAHQDLDRHRRAVGYAGLLGAVARGSGARPAHRGGQLGDAAGTDARNGRNRLPDNVFACARCRSPGARRAHRRSIETPWSRS